MKSRHGFWKLLAPLVPILAVTVSQSQPLQGDEARQTATAPVSCAQFMAPKKDVKGKPVGQEECRLIDRGVVGADKNYHRVDIGISGTLSGFVVKDGARQNYFTSASDFTYTQFG